MRFAGARYDVGFAITYGIVWIVFPNVSLLFTIFLCEVYGSRERDRPPLVSHHALCIVQKRVTHK